MSGIQPFINAIIIAIALVMVYGRYKNLFEHFFKSVNNSFDKITSVFNKMGINKKNPVIKFFSDNKYWIALAFVSVVIVRWYFLNLNTIEFWSDEYAHLFTAKALNETGKPALLSGVLYVRSLVYTYLVAFSFKIFGISEAAARYPSVISGILLLISSYFVAYKFGNKKIAFITVILLEFDPLFYWWSRACRMYILFGLSFFWFIFFFYYAFEELLCVIRKKGSYLKLFIFLLITFALFILSYHLQPIVILVIPALAVYPLMHPEIKISKKVLSVIGVSCAGLLAFYMIMGVTLAKRFIPPQMNIIKSGFVTAYYIEYFLKSYFFLIGLILAGIYFAFKNKNRFLILLCSILIVSFTLLSTFFSNVTDGRFIVHYLAPVYIIAAVGLFGIFSHANKEIFKLKKGVTTIIATVAILLSILVGRNNFNNLDQFDIEGPPNFRISCNYLKTSKKLGYNKKEDIVISTLPLATIYYLGKTDYWLREKIDSRFIIRKKGVSYEMYSNVPSIKDNEQIMKLLKGKRRVWLLIDDKRFTAFLDFKTRTTIGSNTKAIGFFNGVRILRNGVNENSGDSSDPIFFK